MGIPQPPVSMVQLVLLLSCTLLACKLGKSEDDPDARALPTVDSSAPTPQPATPLAPQPAAPAPTPAASVPAAPAPTQPVTGTTGAKPTATTGAKPNTTGAAGTAATTAAAGTSSTTGAAAGTTGAVAGTTGAVKINAECLNKCGNRMRKCFADTKIGEDVTVKCQVAFKRCQTDCLE